MVVLYSFCDADKKMPHTVFTGMKHLSVSPFCEIKMCILNCLKYKIIRVVFVLANCNKI